MFCRIIPSRRIQLLAGAWILSLGFFSCQQKTSTDQKVTGDTIKKPDSVVTTCYEPVLSDSARKKQENNKESQTGIQHKAQKDTLGKNEKTQPKIMCYAPIAPHKKDS